jgi:hypothetical protein
VVGPGLDTYVAGRAPGRPAPVAPRQPDSSSAPRRGFEHPASAAADDDEVDLAALVAGVDDEPAATVERDRDPDPDRDAGDVREEDGRP